jgi:molybdenum cofactor guanylyltransferase
MTTTPPISGYVLAGGRSSRMGTDKSLLPLAGKPLIQHAVTKLRRVCAEVHILSANPALAAYAPLVSDIHPGCGPIGGIEAALAHSPHEWNLILPVDVPFLPTALLESWIAAVTAPDQTTRVAMFSVDGRTQPAVCLLHKQIAPSVVAAVALGEFKLLPVLEASAEVLALQLDQPLDQLISIHPIGVDPNVVSGITPGLVASQPLWFANLNAPEDVAHAEAHLDALDT